MKKYFTLLFFLLVSVLRVQASENSNDSVQQHLRTKLDLLEKHIASLQQQVTTLQMAHLQYQAALKVLQNAVTKPRSKQLIIDRRGGKQASLQ